MSLFSEMFVDSFVPMLMAWHGDKVRYWPLDTVEARDPPIEICKALVSDETTERRRVGDEIEMVTVRSVQIVVDPCHSDFAGVSNPQENAVVAIGDGQFSSSYVIEQLTMNDNGMAALKLLLVRRVALGKKESLEQ